VESKADSIVLVPKNHTVKAHMWDEG